MILNAMPDTPFPENSRRQQEKTSGVTYLHTNDPFAGKAEPATIDSSHPGQHSLMILINAQFTFHDWKKNLPLIWDSAKHVDKEIKTMIFELFKELSTFNFKTFTHNDK